MMKSSVTGASSGNSSSAYTKGSASPGALRAIKTRNNDSIKLHKQEFAAGGKAELPKDDLSGTPIKSPGSVESAWKYLAKAVLFLQSADSEKDAVDLKTLELRFAGFYEGALKPFFEAHAGISQLCGEHVSILKKPDGYKLIDRVFAAYCLLDTYRTHVCNVIEGVQHDVENAADIFAKTCPKKFSTEHSHLGEQFCTDVDRLGDWKITLQSYPGKKFEINRKVGFALLHCGGEQVSLKDKFPVNVLNMLNLAIQQAKEKYFTFRDPGYIFQEPFGQHFLIASGNNEPSLHINDATGEIIINWVYSIFHAEEAPKSQCSAEDMVSLAISSDAQKPLLAFSYKMIIDPPGSPLRDDGRNWSLAASYVDNTEDQRFHNLLKDCYTCSFKVNKARSTCSVTPKLAELIRAMQ
jgi:hypothetical protein